ncbi:hypothetical protein MLD38_026934 [Melastoma candidum]|uniref:Uncharacterized protein n=1 Tax=Melastoma candidum TaxID=119954 RepID=A0ACB9P3K6_9MYRT|nr:hypothetical protein MLD38_026934 [Melastoma candidum]
MASSLNAFLAPILIALAFSSIHLSLAARLLLQVSTTPTTVPTLPLPTIPTLPNPGSLPIPTTLPNPTSLPIPTLPSGLTIPNLPQTSAIPSFFTIPNLSLPPLSSISASFPQITSVPFLAPPPSK